MKKYFVSLFALAVISSCVQLPNLVPDGQGNDSDMNVYDLDSSILYTNFQWPLIVDSNLTFDLVLDPNIGDCGGEKISLVNGQILTPLGFNPNAVLPAEGVYSGLSPGELVNGYATNTQWSPSFLLFRGQFSIGCIYYSTLFTTVGDVYLGFRVKIDQKWHYGWMMINPNMQTDINDPSVFGYVIRKVAYNKSAGTNVRVGE